MRKERFFKLLWQRIELLFAESLKLVDYPADVAYLDSLVVCGRLVYFFLHWALELLVVCKYSLNFASEPIDFLLNNETNSCSEIKRITSFKNILTFTDSGPYQVNVYGPVDKVVTVLVGNGQKGNEDGTTKSCTFAVQPHGIYTVKETNCD